MINQLSKIAAGKLIDHMINHMINHMIFLIEKRYMYQIPSTVLGIVGDLYTDCTRNAHAAHGTHAYCTRYPA